MMVYSGKRLGPRPVKALVLGFTDGAQEGGTASLWGSPPQDSRLKYSTLSLVLWRI
jgi:hypothetical protein